MSRTFQITDGTDSVVFSAPESKTEQDFKGALLKYKRKPFCCGSHEECPTARAPELLPTRNLWGEVLEQREGVLHLGDHMKAFGFSLREDLDSGEVVIDTESVARGAQR